MNENTRPTTEFATLLRQLRDNPSKMEAKSTHVEVTNFLGATESWIIRTIVVDGGEYVFLNCVREDGDGLVAVIPPPVTRAMGKQRDVIAGIGRRRAAAKAKATKMLRAAEKQQKGVA